MKPEIELLRHGIIKPLRGDELADRVGSIIMHLVSLDMETAEQYQRRVGHTAIKVVAAHLLSVVSPP